MLADPTRTAHALPRWVTGRAGPLSSLTGRPTPPPTAQRARACVPAARSTKQLSEAYGPLLGAGARPCFPRSPARTLKEAAVGGVRPPPGRGPPPLLRSAPRPRHGSRAPLGRAGSEPTRPLRALSHHRPRRGPAPTSARPASA